MLFKTPPLHVLDVPADAYHYTVGRSSPIQVIVLHATEGTNSAKWLSSTSPRSKPVSVHRLITPSGLIVKIVGDADTAYHAGPSQRWQAIGNDSYDMNSISLGIELEALDRSPNDYKVPQLRACASQIVEWWGAYGLLPIVYHWQVQANKTDPQHLPRVQLDRYIVEALRALL